MRLSAIFIPLLLTATLEVVGQEGIWGWKEGGYRSWDDLWEGKVALTGPFAFRAVGGLGLDEHYKMNQIPEWELKSIRCIHEGTSIYLNIAHLGMGKGFIRVPEPRMYTYFEGVPRDNVEKMYRNAGAYGAAFGLIGGLASSAAHNLSTPIIPYLLNLETGQVNELTERHMLRILEPYERLYNAYRIDEGRIDINVALLYIELLNDAVEYGEY